VAARELQGLVAEREATGHKRARAEEELARAKSDTADERERAEREKVKGEECGRRVKEMQGRLKQEAEKLHATELLEAETHASFLHFKEQHAAVQAEHSRAQKAFLRAQSEVEGAERRSAAVAEAASSQRVELEALKDAVLDTQATLDVLRDDRQRMEGTLSRQADRVAGCRREQATAEVSTPKHQDPHIQYNVLPWDGGEIEYQSRYAPAGRKRRPKGALHL
jgi:chromosome segregation ATPase